MYHSTLGLRIIKKKKTPGGQGVQCRRWPRACHTHPHRASTTRRQPRGLRTSVHGERARRHYQKTWANISFHEPANPPCSWQARETKYVNHADSVRACTESAHNLKLWAPISFVEFPRDTASGSNCSTRNDGDEANAWHSPLPAASLASEARDGSRS